MNRIDASWAAVAAVAVALSAQASPPTLLKPLVERAPVQIRVPESSLPHAEAGVRRARTHLRYIVLPPHVSRASAPQPKGLPPVPGYAFETPASVACVYRLVGVRVDGCNPNLATTNPSGGSGAIALVDAYDYPEAAQDLAAFSQQFGLPSANFQVVYAGGAEPAADTGGGWELEEALDIEWAHAMAPSAKLFLVEANSSSFDDLMQAVQLAGRIVASNGGGEVSMSWGGSEFIEQTYFDEQFTQPGVVYFASSGDSPGTSWPATSPNVVAVGGTTLSRDPLTGDFLVENTWQDAGGGPSLVENRPDFQNRLARTVGPTRGTPDISFDANPATGVWVLDSHPIGNDSPGWLVVGGTSLSSPAVAAITNTKGQFRLSSEAENELLYSGKFGTEEVVLGNCGLNAGDFAREGWSFCTGIGSPRGKRLKHSVND